MGKDIRQHLVIPFQIKSFFLVYDAVKTTIHDQVGWWGINGKGDLSVSVLRGLMCTGGMGCGSRWVMLCLTVEVDTRTKCRRRPRQDRKECVYYSRSTVN